MATSAWRDKAKPIDAPQALGIHFGTRGGWGTNREGVRVDLYANADGHLVILQGARRAPVAGYALVAESVCYLCHDGLTSARMPDLIVCGACGRYSADGDRAKILAASPPPPEDTPEERARWDALPDHEKYPDRRPAPPVDATRRKPAAAAEAVAT